MKSEKELDSNISTADCAASAHAKIVIARTAIVRQQPDYAPLMPFHLVWRAVPCLSCSRNWVA